MLFDEVMALDGAHLVRACYHEILQRNPDQEGLANHSAALAHGVPKAALIVAIAASEEACLSGRALSPLAVRARDRVYLDDPTVSAWMRLPPVMKHYRRRQEAEVAAKVADVQRIAREKEGLGNAPPVPKPSPIEVIRIASEVFETKVLNARRSDLGVSTLWFDLTTCLQWTQGVVGIVRAELEIAVGLYRLDPSVRYSVQVDHGFAEVRHEDLAWLLNADNVVDAYMKFFGRYEGAEITANRIKVEAPKSDAFFHPYAEGDVVFSVGWMDSQKEAYFSLLKEQSPSVFIVYLIYDMILVLPDTRHFYSKIGQEQFHTYVKWIAHHCDMILYGGETARGDAEAYQRGQGWPTPPGYAVKFGTDIVKAKIDELEEAQLLLELGVKGDFILTVGSIEPRKNHDTLYRAYLLLLEKLGDATPQLVIVGKPMWRSGDLVDLISRHPALQGRVICVRPTDLELAALYNQCLFTVLPSVYEGWSLTLPESLGHGKFCICSDTPPLREIGGDLVDYVQPFDARGWADTMAAYCSDRALLAIRTDRVIAGWPALKWTDTARMAVTAIKNHINTHRPVAIRSRGALRANEWTRPQIWMDLTLSYLQWQGGISGIVRAELELARNFKLQRPETRFFAYESEGNYFFEISAELLLWLFKKDDISKAYQSFHEFWRVHESQGSGYRDPFRLKIEPSPDHPAYLAQLPTNAIVFFAGIDMDGTGTVRRTKQVAALIEDNSAVMRTQLIYDLTPILYPHLHLESTTIGFQPFFENVSQTFEFIVYGGQTAEHDGRTVQSDRGWRVPPSCAMKFGSDIVKARRASPAQDDQDEGTLLNLGVENEFLLMVGTIEPRKNHEVIYKAYLRLLQSDQLKSPLQIVFAGKPGWNCDDFLAILNGDDRVRGRIIVTSPSDAELDVLYRRCLFTLLPSFYEGWSLTLPESLAYGKFCLTSDVAPLREIGGALVDYVHPLDAFAWADQIAHYATNRDELAEKEATIRDEWKPLNWNDATRQLIETLESQHREQFEHLFAAMERD